MLSANASINAKLTASSFSLGFASDVKILKVRNNLHSKIGEDYVIWVSWKWLLQERLLKYLLKFTKQFRKSLLEWVNVRSYSLYVFYWVQEICMLGEEWSIISLKNTAASFLSCLHSRCFWINYLSRTILKMKYKDKQWFLWGKYQKYYETFTNN